MHRTHRSGIRRYVKAGIRTPCEVVRQGIDQARSIPCFDASTLELRNWAQVEQLLFNYGSAVRNILYTANAIESLNSSFRKATKKGAFPSEDAILKALYLQRTELYKKWANRPVPNWAMVRNQLSMDAGIQARIMKDEKY